MIRISVNFKNSSKKKNKTVTTMLIFLRFKRGLKKLTIERKMMSSISKKKSTNLKKR